MQAYIDSHYEEVAKLGWNGLSKTTGQMKTADSLRWVNPLELKTAVEQVFVQRFGKKEDKSAPASKLKKDKVSWRSNEPPKGGSLILNRRFLI